jgi:hypothetical protein
LLQRQVFQVDALDLEHGVRIGFGHGDLSARKSKRPAVDERAVHGVRELGFDYR